MMLALATTFALPSAWADNSGSIAADSNAGTIASYTNSGNIGTLSNSGTIDNAGSTIGLHNSGSIGTLSNTGLITAGFFAILQENGANITQLDNSGTLSGSTAIINNGHIGTLTNSGQITNAGQNILLSANGSIDSIVNTSTGVITASRFIYSSGSVGTINNSGLIRASTLLEDDSNGSFGAVTNSGILAGAITLRSAGDLLISGGSGTTFGTLTGWDGNNYVIGEINTVGNVSFTGGNQILNDNITTNSGSGTVTNTGNSVLQLNEHIGVTGNYVQNAGATLAIGVSDAASSTGLPADTGYGRLVVSGSAYLASGSSILLKALNSYAFAAGQRYVVIQASTTGTDYNASSLHYSVSGSGSSSVQASGVQQIDNGYANLLVTLVDATTGSTAIARYASTRNAASTLNGLFGYSGSNQGLLDVFNPAVALADTASANRAGAQLSPAATGNAAVNGVNTAAEAITGAARSRLDTLHTAQLNGTGGVATGESSLSPVVWGRLFGGHATQSERDGVAGYSANFSGMVIGSDAEVSPDWRAGALASYARVNVGNAGDNSGSSAHVNSYGLTAYAAYDGRPWYVQLTGGVARQQYSSLRLVSFTGFSGGNHGSFNGLLYSTTLQAGYPLALGSATLTPKAGLAYANLRHGGYTETGSSAALVVDGSGVTSLKSELAVKWEDRLVTGQGELKPFAQVGWHHEFHTAPMITNAAFAADTTGTTAFAAQGSSLLRNTAQLSLGATLARSKNLSLAARYTVEAARGYTAQTGEVSVRWEY